MKLYRLTWLITFWAAVILASMLWAERHFTEHSPQKFRENASSSQPDRLFSRADAVVLKRGIFKPLRMDDAPSLSSPLPVYSHYTCIPFPAAKGATRLSFRNTPPGASSRAPPEAA